MKKLQVLLLFIGCFLLYWVVKKTGVQQLMDSLTTLGWRIIFPILIGLFICFLTTGAWWQYLKRFEHQLKFFELLSIRLVGEATNTLTPVNFAGGDPIRIWMLSRHISAAHGGASVVIDRTVQILSTIILITVGTAVAILHLNLPTSVDMILAGTVLLFLFLTSLLLRQQSKGFFQSLANWTTRWPKIHKVFEQLKETDDLMVDFYQKDRKIFAGCLVLHTAARFAGMLEVYLLAYYLNIPMDWWQALFFNAVFPVVNFLGTIVPGAIGVMEGVVGALFYSMHWNPADGVALQIARRLRTGFWIGIGLLILFFKRHNKPIPTPAS